MTDIEKAKNLLAESNSTCVLVKKNEVYTSKERGVAPMLGFLSSNTVLAGFSAADKVVGRAAAFLFVLAGVVEVYAEILSLEAQKVFEQNSIKYSFGLLAKSIVNRAGTGLCPMEQAVLDIDLPLDAYKAITEKLKALKAEKNQSN